MQLDHNTLEKKEIVPWYDSETACYVILIFLFLVILFSAVGLSVSNENPEYSEYFKIPVLLLTLSIIATISTIIRLIKRYISRFQTRYLKDFHYKGNSH